MSGSHPCTQRPPPPRLSPCQRQRTVLGRGNRHYAGTISRTRATAGALECGGAEVMRLSVVAVYTTATVSRGLIRQGGYHWHGAHTAQRGRYRRERSLGGGQGGTRSGPRSVRDLVVVRPNARRRHGGTGAYSWPALRRPIKNGRVCAPRLSQSVPTGPVRRFFPQCVGVVHRLD